MKSIYKNVNPIAVRVALGTAASYDQILDDENLSEMDDKFKESILVATYDLYKSLSKDKSDKKYEDMLRSVLKYQIRRMCRCTPYGLFAGIGLSGYSEKTSLIIDSSKVKKRARVDMKWLFGYINHMIQDDSVLFKLKIKSNRLCYKNGDRFINPFFSAGGNAEGNESTCFTIRFTRPVEYIMNRCQDFVVSNTILNELTENFEVSEDKAKKFLLNLIEHEFLILDIFPPFINTEPLSYVIEVLKSGIAECSHIEFLTRLYQKIEDYNKLEIGEGILKFQEIVNFMSTKVETKDYLQIDTKINFIGEGISSKVGKEVEKLVNLITMLSEGYSEQEYLKKYKDEFLEKYGYCTEVPIMEMLDYNIGIGIPANYKNSKKDYIEYSIHNKLLDELNKFIINKGIDAIKHDTDIVRIEDEDVKKICKDSVIKEEKLLNSLDLFAQVLANSQEAIDEGEFNLLLSGCISSSGGLNSLGRFSDLFWDECKFDTEVLEKEKELLGKDYIAAELVEQFRAGRTANVDMNMNSLEHQICISCNGCKDKKTIELDDVYIGIDSDTNQFYAKSHKLNKRIYARTTHMLNTVIGSNPYRFLRDISSIGTKFQLGETIASIGVNDFDYFPRIMYGRTILQPAKWHLNCGKTKGKKFEDWDDEFLSWITEHKTPNYVNYVIGDNFLRLNLQNKRCRELLYYGSLNNDSIILTEEFANNTNLWLTDSFGNKHCCEMVFTLIKKEAKRKPNIKTDIMQEKQIFSNEIDRILFPGEKGWYYYKLYGMSERENEFIGIDLKDLASHLKEQDIIKEHFFIRYGDTRKHIRIRFQVKEGMDERFLSTFHEWLIKEHKRGIIADLSLSVYEREIERYGGYSLINIAEQAFCADSILVERLKEAEYYKELTLPKECIGIWSVNGFLESFNKNLEESERWMSLTIKKNEYRDNFKKDDKRYCNSLSLKDNELPGSILQAYQDRNNIVRKFYSEISYEKKNGILSNTENDILSSLIHMFCNRYMADNTWERKVRALTRHSLYSTLSSIKYQQKHK